MEEAEELCDRLAILHAGRVSVVGTPAELRAGLGASATMDDTLGHSIPEMIAADAEAWPADLIMICTHGRRG